MRIVQFDEKNADEMAQLYAKEYSEGDGKDWTVEKAKQSIEVCYKYYSKFCLMAEDEKGECLGAIFSIVNPYFSGDILLIITIQVKPEFRKMGIGKALLKKSVEYSRESGLAGIRLLTDARKDFPRGWYEKLGFVKSGFVEYEVDLDKVKIE